MNKKGYLVARIFFFLVFLGAILFGGFAIFQAGKSIGFQMGVTASQITAAENQPVNPMYWHSPYISPHMGYMGFPFFGLLCFFGLIPLTLLFFGMLFRPWRRMGDWHGYHHSHAHHWGSPPAPKEQEPGVPQGNEKE